MTAEKHQLPPCRFSSQCPRFIDELATPSRALQSGPLSSIDDLRDEELLAELREHVPTCPTCQATLAEARHARSQQRTALRGLLAAGEQYVPSTTASIFTALHREAQPARSSARNRLEPVRDITPDVQPPNGRLRPTSQSLHPKRRRTLRTLTRNVFAVAAVVIIVLASIGIFSQLIAMRSHQGTNIHYTYTQGWNAVAVSVIQNNHLTIKNYDPLSGKSSALIAPVTITGTAGIDGIDGISHDGHNILYHYTSGNHTYYATLVPSSNTSYFYELNADNAGAAIWMSDNLHVLIATQHSGIVEVDTQTGTSQRFANSGNVNRLWFYRDNYLYYTSGLSDLFRVNITNGHIEQVTHTFRGSNYLLSPDGTTIFYIDNVNTSSVSSPTAIYTVAVNRPGISQKLLEIDAVPIGFASDNTLMLAQKKQGTFQVLKLKPTQPAVEGVIASDIAPGAGELCDSHALPICSQAIALAPYGQNITVISTDTNGNHAIWATDLTTGKHHLLQTLPSTIQQVQLPGWDRISVPGTTPPTPVVTSPTAIPTVPYITPSYGWNGIVTTSNGSNGFTIASSDYRTGQSSAVSTNGIVLPASTQIDGVSPDGKNMLYHFSSSGHTQYYTLQQVPNTGFFYQLTDSNAGNAFWLDNRYVLIATHNSGVMKVDTQTGQTQNLFPTLNMANVQQIITYRNNFLYFTATGTLENHALYRVPLNGNTPAKIAPAATSYWFTPNGKTIFFFARDVNGEPTIFYGNSDGSNIQILRTMDARPIGFAYDNALMVMREVNQKFEIVKLGILPQYDQVIISDVVSGAVSLCNTGANNTGLSPICDSNIALSPYGHGVVVLAYYPDGSRRLWSIDLTTSRRVELQLPNVQSSTTIQLIGWDTIPSQ